VGETQPGGGASVTAEVAGRRFRLASPPAAAVLGTLGLVLIATWVPLTYLTRDPQATRDGFAPAFALACGLLGLLVARRQPRNLEGWLLLGLAVGVIAVLDSGLYAVLDYRLHDGRLPLGETAVFIKDVGGQTVLLLFPLVILLFPDGRLTRPWTWVLRSYLVLVVVLTVGTFADEAGAIVGHPVQVDLSGAYSGQASPSGVLGALAAVAGVGFIIAPPFWPAFVARQIFSWRRSASERRQQLKWLMCGAAIALAGLAVVVLGPPKDQTPGRVARDLAFVALAALPVSMGVGILKYHLYDIDRLISRTLSYTLVSGVLVGVYAGIVTLATRVLPFSSPVGVAASTLAVAALFNPVRRRVQRAVDRRFNRTRYDAEATVAVFAAGLKDAVELDSVRDDLASVVQQTLEPAHVSIWISRPRLGMTAVGSAATAVFETGSQTRTSPGKE
jgi:F0F1-type ATP synthase assembly protein I